MGRSPPTPSAAGISVSSSRRSMRTMTTIDRATPRWTWRTPRRRMMWAKSRAPRARPSCRPRAAPGRAADPSARRRSCARTRRGPRRRRPPRPCASPAGDPGCRSLPPSRSLSNPPVDGASTSRRPAFFSSRAAPSRAAPSRCSIPPPRGGTPRGVPIPRSSSSRARSVACVARPSSSRLRLLVQLLLLGRKNCLARTIFARARQAKKPPPLYARCPARDATARGTPLIRAPRVPAGKPVGPGSGRWLSRVDPTAVGVVNGVVGGEAVSVPRLRVRPSSRWSAFSFGQRVESRLRKTTRPGRALSSDREGSKGLPVDRKRPEGRFRWPGGKLLPGLGFTGARLARVLPRGVLGSNRNRG